MKHNPRIPIPTPAPDHPLGGHERTWGRTKGFDPARFCLDFLFNVVRQKQKNVVGQLHLLAAGRLPLWMGLAGVQASSSKQQASIRHQAASIKHQAASIKKLGSETLARN